MKNILLILSILLLSNCTTNLIDYNETVKIIEKTQISDDICFFLTNKKEDDFLINYMGFYDSCHLFNYNDTLKQSKK